MVFVGIEQSRFQPKITKAGTICRGQRTGEIAKCRGTNNLKSRILRRTQR
jgi:hypothetical protein